MLEVFNKYDCLLIFRYKVCIVEKTKQSSFLIGQISNKRNKYNLSAIKNKNGRTIFDGNVEYKTNPQNIPNKVNHLNLPFEAA